MQTLLTHAGGTNMCVCAVNSVVHLGVLVTGCGQSALNRRFSVAGNLSSTVDSVFPQSYTVQIYVTSWDTSRSILAIFKFSRVSVSIISMCVSIEHTGVILKTAGVSHSRSIRSGQNRNTNQIRNRINDHRTQHMHGPGRLIMDKGR